MNQGGNGLNHLSLTRGLARGLAGRGNIDFFNLAPYRSDPLTNEDVLAFASLWTIVTGWSGLGLVFCMSIYDVFHKWSRFERRKGSIGSLGRARGVDCRNQVTRVEVFSTMFPERCRSFCLESSASMSSRQSCRLD